jgi:rRNA maturation protein Rpf1
MRLLKINNLLNELNFKINKQKEIESFLNCKAKDGIIRVEGTIYGSGEEDIIKLKEILEQYKDRLFELEEMDI